MFHSPISPPGLPLSGETAVRGPSPLRAAQRAEAVRRARAARFAKLVDQFGRDEIEAAVDGLIVMLDQRDGDPDREPNGDELDGNSCEDDFMHHDVPFPGPGCELSDPGEATGDDQGDVAWTEWHGRSPRQRRHAQHEQTGKARVGEDDEEDNEDCCDAGEDNLLYGEHDGLPGDPDDAEHDHVTDPLEGFSDLTAYYAHVRRIRSTRCEMVHVGHPRFGWDVRRLRRSGTVVSFGRRA